MFYFLFQPLNVLYMYWLFTGSFKGWFPLWMNMRHGSNHSKVFCKKVVFRNFAKFTGKYLCQSFFLHKVVGLRPATLLKKRPWHRWFPVNFVKFLRTSFLTEHLRWLLLEACLYKQFLTHISPSGNTVGTALRPKSALLCKTTLCKLCKPPQSTLRVSLGGI